MDPTGAQHDLEARTRASGHVIVGYDSLVDMRRGTTLATSAAALLSACVQREAEPPPSAAEPNRAPEIDGEALRREIRHARQEEEKWRERRMSAEAALAQLRQQAVPAPLADGEVERMTLQQAQEALALVARARQRPDLSPEDMERLRREFNLLLERLRKRDLPRG